MNTADIKLRIPSELIRTAYVGVSFDPEKRGLRAVEGYNASLQQAVDKMAKHAAKAGTQHLLEEQVIKYVTGYQRRVIALLNSESRCVSSFIVGPAKFPVERMRKRSDLVHARLNDLTAFEYEALKAAIRVLRPDLQPIRSSDADAIERLELKLHQAERLQEKMKTANAAIRKHAKARQGHQVTALLELGFTESQAVKLLEPDFAGRVGFPDYATKNNGTCIRQIKARIEQLQKTQNAPVTEVQTAAGIRVEEDPPANRVRVFFPDKPAESIRSELKKNGFRWAPSVGAWQAYHNHSSVRFAHQISA